MIPTSHRGLVDGLEHKLDLEFRDKVLPLTALTHRSYLNENPEAFWGHNERLEYLGDAVIEICVAEALFARFPDHTEGELTVLRSALVSAKPLALVGQTLGLPDNLLVSSGERSSGLNDQKVRQRLTACAVEAILGAIHRDQGIGMSRLVVDSLILSRFDELVDLHTDPKGELHEQIQGRHGVTPQYTVISESGPDHAKRYRVGVFAGRIQLGIGTGTSKAEADMAAATDALTHFKPEARHAR